MKKNLSTLLHRLFTLLLVVVFMVAGTFTGFDVAFADEHPVFSNPDFIDADANKIVLEAVQDSFNMELTSGTQSYTGGMLYKATSYPKTDTNNSSPTDYPAKYTPPVLVVSPGNTIDLTLKNSLPVLEPEGSAVPQVQYNIEAVSQDTNLHYHGFNVSPLLGSDDVVVHVHSGNTSKNNNYHLASSTSQSALPIPGLDSSTPNEVLDPDFVDTQGANFPIGTGGPAIQPINEYKMTVNIPEGHQKGLFWYHPHVHGASDRQVQYGMSGGIIVKGIGEAFPILKNITRENGDDYGQVMLFKYFKGKFFNGGNGTGKFFTLNDAQDPKIDIAQNDVQLWRIANISADNYLNLTFINPSAEGKNHSSDLNLPKFGILSRDVSNTYFTSDEAGGDVGQAEFVDSILVPPAGRVELLMDATSLTADSAYELVSVTSDNKPHPYEDGDNLGGDKEPAIDNLASLNVTSTLRANSKLKRITQLSGGELLLNARGKRELKDVCEGESLGDCLRSLKTTELAAEEILPSAQTLANYNICAYSEANDTCVVNSHSSVPNDKFEFVFDSTYLNPATQTQGCDVDPKPDECKDLNKVFNMNNELYDGVRIDKVVNVGTNQEWTLTNSEVGDHAFHIHQLDFITTEVDVPEDYIEDRGDTSYYDNYQVSCTDIETETENPRKHCTYNDYGYRDTINLPANSKTVVRIPFLNPFITGVFVYHCHILGHEDTGMMQNIQVVNPNSYIPTPLLEGTRYQLRSEKSLGKNS